MTQKFHFELVSPEEKLMSEDVTMVTIPGEEGDFGVLAGHSPLLSSIRPGVITINVEANDNPKRIFIAGGFADVTAAQCIVLAEEATDLSLVDVTALDAEIAALSASSDDRAAYRLGIAQAKRKAIQ